MFDAAKKVYVQTLGEIREAGLFKEERIITTPQSSSIKSSPREGEPTKEVLNFCANNYLGLSSHPEVIAAAKRAIDTHGFGLSSVRFICGTQDIHKQLEHTISKFFGLEDTILYTSCFDANGGLFETLLGEEDAIISDALNHASIIDGIRLCKAERHRYPNGDMQALEDALKKTQGKRLRMIATDGVFSMDGYIAKLDLICDLAEKYDAMVMVDDCHATGFIGKTGRGTPEHCGVMHRVDVLTGTLGKALGGGLLPVSAFLAREDVMAVFRPGDHGSTFGGNPLAAAVGEAALALLENGPFCANATTQGEYLLSRLRSLRHPAITGIRGLGLFVGVDFDPAFASARRICDELVGLGVLTKDTHGTVVRLAPALTIERAEIDFAVEALSKALQAIEAAEPVAA